MLMLNLSSINFFFILYLQVLYFQALVITFMIGKIMNKIFFGQLRAIEIEVS
jgi:hypothetical protein